jgi:hypothetical protein
MAWPLAAATPSGCGAHGGASGAGVRRPHVWLWAYCGLWALLAGRGDALVNEYTGQVAEVVNVLTAVRPHAVQRPSRPGRDRAPRCASRLPTTPACSAQVQSVTPPWWSQERTMFG